MATHIIASDFTLHCHKCNYVVTDMSSVICLHEEGSSSISFIIDVTYISGCTMAHMVSH